MGYCLINVRAVSMKKDEHYVDLNAIPEKQLPHVFIIHIVDNDEIKEIMLEAADAFDRDLWFNHIKAMASEAGVDFSTSTEVSDKSHASWTPTPELPETDLLQNLSDFDDILL